MEKLSIINDAKDELVDTVTRLEQITHELADAIRGADVVASKFITIPAITMDEEKHRLLNGPPRFLKVHNGELNAGLSNAVSHFGFFYTEYGMSTRYSPNFPGIICIRDSPANIIELTEYANTLKLYFSAVLKNMSEALKAYYSADGLNPIIFDAIHSRMPMLLTECVTRKIQLQKGAVNAAYFTMRTNFKKNAIERERLIRKLQDQLAKAQDAGEKNLSSSICEELAIVRNSGFSVFGYPKSTTPTAALTLKLKGEIKPINYRACLPLIVLDQGDDAPIIYDMADYDADARANRKKRTVGVEPVALYPRTGLFGYE